MQGRPQLVVLGIHIRTVGKEQLDDFLEVVDATLQGGDTGRVSSRQGPKLWWGHTKFTWRGRKEDSGAKLPEFEPRSSMCMLCDLGQVS